MAIVDGWMRVFDSLPKLSMDLKLKQMLLVVETSCSDCTDSQHAHTNKYHTELASVMC